MVLGGLAFMVSFLILSFFHPEFRQILRSDPRIFPTVLVFMYLLFLIPSRRLFRFQKFAQTALSTSRRGFTFKDSQGEKILSWRDVTQARVIIDVDRRHNAYPSKIILVYTKGRITLENDPPANELQGAQDLVRQIRKRVANTVFRFHWFHALCPFCRTALEARGKTCPSCGERVEYVPKLLRPWELIREEGLYLILIILVAGVLFYPLALLYVAVALLLPWLWNRAGTLKPLRLSAPASSEIEEGGDDRDAQSSGNATLIVAAAAGLLLLLGDASAAPALAAPAPQKAPLATAAYFPLAVGNMWEYTSNFNRIQVRVTGRDAVNGVPCYVVETFVAGASVSSQVEYYAVTPEGVQVLKRTHKGSDYILKVPETMLAFPPSPGRRWTWEGDAATGNVVMTFSIRSTVQLEVAGRQLVTLLVVVHGRSADGSELQTKRWYSAGIGMVRELTLMKKGARALKVDATLVNYQVNPESSHGSQAQRVVHEDFPVANPN